MYHEFNKNVVYVGQWGGDYNKSFFDYKIDRDSLRLASDFPWTT